MITSSRVVRQLPDVTLLQLVDEVQYFQIVTCQDWQPRLGWHCLAVACRRIRISNDDDGRRNVHWGVVGCSWHWAGVSFWKEVDTTCDICCPVAEIWRLLFYECWQHFGVPWLLRLLLLLSGWGSIGTLPGLEGGVVAVGTWAILQLWNFKLIHWTGIGIRAGATAATAGGRSRNGIGTRSGLDWGSA